MSINITGPQSRIDPAPPPGLAVQHLNLENTNTVQTATQSSNVPQTDRGVCLFTEPFFVLPLPPNSLLPPNTLGLNARVPERDEREGGRGHLFVGGVVAAVEWVCLMPGARTRTRLHRGRRRGGYAAGSSSMGRDALILND